ncbi:MAG: cysteine synthase A [Chitinivibrionia bacterium]|nr:cysteine synthase A [Chitinivibrionia bacterium]
MAVLNSIIDGVGKTPLVKLNKLTGDLSAQIWVKAEFFNPLSSVKDRLGKALIADAEEKGLIKNDTLIIEPTSGNTGVALAYICAAKGYKLILTMPESMSIERRKLLSALGAELVLTPANLGMKGAIDEAEKLKNERNGIILGQFTNPANPAIHQKTTGPEIWNDLDGKVDIFVAGVGTGGTITGAGRFLKSQKSDVKIVAVEPKNSPVLSGGQAGAHKIQGIGAGFIPKIADTALFDEIIQAPEEEAGEWARRAAKEEGLLIGISSGANIFAAVELAKRPENAGKNIITVANDSGERYLSTWLFEK